MLYLHVIDECMILVTKTDMLQDYFLNCWWKLHIFYISFWHWTIIV